MKRISITFLQIVLVLIGLGVLALMLWEPHLEGRNAQATLFEIYFKDPFLAYAYVGSIAFFYALYQAFKLLAYIKHDKIFSNDSVRALRTIRYCATVLIAFIIGAEAYVLIAVHGNEDSPGGILIGLVLMGISIGIAATAAIFERTLKSAVKYKREIDLTV